MHNVTQHLKDNGLFKKGLLQNFLRMERVKYLIASGERVEATCGRYGQTFFSDGLFEAFLNWLERKPLALLNRKEYEVHEFIVELFGAEVIAQHRVGNFVYDWFVPSLNLLIEFNEKEHIARSKSRINDKAKQRSNLFIIHEATVMKDLAALARKFQRDFE